MKTQADILLVTVTKVESMAVMEAFAKHTGQKARLEPRSAKQGITNHTKQNLHRP